MSAGTNRAPGPSFSIVTPCLNRADMIARAVDSVLAQDQPGVEHLVMDGGSTDGTLDVLRRYPGLLVHSEPDRNLYDAINKGLARAGGDVIGILNSDDAYAPGAFPAVAEAFADPAVEVVIGGAEIVACEAGGETVLRRFEAGRGSGLSEANAIGNVTLINACFWRRDIFARVGTFDTRFGVAADKDFWMRLALANPVQRLLPRIVYRYLSHAGSLTFSGGDTRQAVSADLLALAATRLREYPPGTAGHAAYRRWHAWAVGYRAMVQMSAGQPREAWRTAGAGLAVDAGWPVRFATRLAAHWRDRDIRRGAP